MDDDVRHQIVVLLERRGPLAEGRDHGRYRFLDNGHVDSFGLVEFILEVEEYFGIRLSPEDTQSDEFRYVDGLAGIVREKLDGK